MKEEKDQFVSLMQDNIFKTVWSSGNEKVKKYLNRIISYIIGYNVKDFHLSTNELPLNNSLSIANKVDILLESNDKLKKVNIELNPINKKITENKNLSYLFKIAGEFYAGMEQDRYVNNINVEQVNLNGFYHEKKTLHMRLIQYTMLKIKRKKKSIKIHDVFLPRMKELCYDNKEIYLDFSMFCVQVLKRWKNA